jgi:hypothetical protein
MEAIELLGKLWYLGAAIVAIAAYSVITELWKHVNELKGKH